MFWTCEPPLRPKSRAKSSTADHCNPLCVPTGRKLRTGLPLFFDEGYTVLNILMGHPQTNIAIVIGSTRRKLIALANEILSLTINSVQLLLCYMVDGECQSQVT